MTDKEFQLFRQVWLKALLTSEVVLKFPRVQDAYRIRFGLYELRRQVKAGKIADSELLKAVTTCSIHFDKEAATLKVGTKFYSDAFQILAEAVDYVPDTSTEFPSNQAVLGVDAETLKIIESQKKLQSILGQESAGENSLEPDKPTFDFAAIKAQFKKAD